MDVVDEMLNPIEEILGRWQALSDCPEIHLFFDRNAIPIPQDIDDIFGAATWSLDDIIRHANTLQTIGEDQLDQIEWLQVLLGESLDRTNGLNQQQARIGGLLLDNLSLRLLNRHKDVQINRSAKSDTSWA